MWTPPKWQKFGAAMLAFVLLVAACGGENEGSSLSGDDKALAGAFARDIGLDRDSAFSDKEIWCIADQMVSSLGGADAVEAKYRLNADNIAAGVKIDSLDPDDANAVAAAYGDCADLASTTRDNFGSEGFSDDDAACLTDSVGVDVYLDLLAAQLTGDSLMRTNAANNLRTARVEAGESCGVEINA